MNNVGGSTCNEKCIAEEHECTECIAERKRRCRVYNSGIMKGRDNRMSSDEFRNAISIVANNDLKDQICKVNKAQLNSRVTLANAYCGVMLSTWSKIPI